MSDPHVTASRKNAKIYAVGWWATLTALFRFVYCFVRGGAVYTLLDLGVIPRPFSYFYKVVARRNSKEQRAKKLQLAVARLGGSYAKLGQALSVRPDLVGVSTARALAKLQDRLPALPAAVIRKEIELAFGKKIDEIYKNFEDNAAAAASVAQVHRAQTLEGKVVAVKVLRPRIEEQFRREVALTKLAIKFIEWRTPRLKDLRFQIILDTYAEWLEGELDLRREAAAACTLAENMRGEKKFRVPAIDWARTNKRVLTLEWIDGVRIDDAEALQKFGVEREELLDRSARIFFKQTFRDGFFHADIHPGNLFIEPDGTMVPVDFGIMGHISLKTRHYLADILKGFMERDYRMVAKAYIDAGYTAHEVDLDSLTLACRSVGEPLFGSKNLNDISFAELLLGVISIGDRFKLDTQTKLLLLHKSMLQGEGMGLLLNSRVNIWLRTKPLIEQWLLDNRNPRTALLALAAKITAKVTDGLAGLLADKDEAQGGGGGGEGAGEQRSAGRSGEQKLAAQLLSVAKSLQKISRKISQRSSQKDARENH